LTSPKSHVSPHRRFSVAPQCQVQAAGRFAKRSRVVAATIETLKIHKPIGAGERHFRSAQSKKLQNSPGFCWEHLVMHRLIRDIDASKK
jgi:hypothetical protein